MRRENGFVRFLFGMMLTLVLVLGVCGGVGADDNKAATKVTPEQIDQIERKLFSIESDITEIKTFQVNNSGQMWFERTREQAETTEKWVNSEREKIEQWSSSLNHTTTVGGIVIAILGVGISGFSLYTANRQRLDANTAKQNLDAEIENFKNEAAIKKEALDGEQKKIKEKQHKTQEQLDRLESKEIELNTFIAQKETELSALEKRCEKIVIRCETNLGKTDDAASEALNIVEHLNGEMKNFNDKEKEAVQTVAESTSETTYAHMKAKALKHEINTDWNNALLVWKSLAQEFSDKSEPFFKIALIYEEFATQTNDKGKHATFLDKAEKYYEKAIKINPDLTYALTNLATLLSHKATNTSAPKKQAIQAKAEKKFRLAIEINPQDHHAWNNLALLLIEKSEEKRTKDLSKEIRNCFIRATTIKKDYVEAWCNWGLYILSNQTNADNNQNENRVKLAEEKFCIAIDIDPNHAASWKNLATITGKKAISAANEERDILLKKSIEQFKHATDCSPDYRGAWFNCAAILTQIAYDTNHEDKKESLLLQAEKNIQKAYEIDSSSAETLSAWANNLLVQATLDENKSDNILLEKAKEKAIQAENRKEGIATYNLACIASLQNNFEECKDWLTKSKKLDANFVGCEHLKSDPDLDNIRNHPDYKDWFEDFVNQVCQEEQEAKGKQAESDEDDTDTEE